MQCTKAPFDTRKLATKRAKEINKENRESNKRTRLIAYVKPCDICGKWHLTKMKEFQQKMKHDIDFRVSHRESMFIHRETEHYNKRNNEHDISDGLPYNCLSIKRFAIPQEEMEKLLQMCKDCADLNGIDIDIEKLTEMIPT